MKILTKQTAISLLIDIIKGDLRHQDYDRVVKMADTLNKLITGENMDSLMRKFDRRESKSQFEQRKRITQHITSTVCQNLMKPAFKIPRSNGVRRVLKYTDDEENKKLKKFEDILGHFWGNESLDDYMGERWIELEYSDPNSFLVYEWGDFDNKKENAKPYPFEVSAEEAIFYQYDNNLLQYLVVLNEFKMGAGGLMQKVELDPKSINANVQKRFTLYAKGYSITFDQLDKESEDKVMPKPVDGQYDVEAIVNRNTQYVNVAGKIYKIGIYDSGLDFIPVTRIGFRKDIYTKGRTCVSPINEAVPILMKTIKANSELDLAMALHAHPQRVQYLQECTAGCNRGRMPDGKNCPVCDGTGMKKTPTSAQESIDLLMPRDKEDVVSLENIVSYITPSVDLIRFQDEYIRSLMAQCKEAIYNSEIFSRQQIAETATGKNIDLQNVYDSLYTFAKAFARTWEYSIMAISKITDMDEGLVYAYIFSRDFKMKSLNDLYNDLKLVSDSKAPAFIKQSIYDDIARFVYTDDPVGYQKWKTKEAFDPYTGKSEEETMGIISTLPNTDFNRVLWESYGWIFSALEREYEGRKANFYEISRTAQWNAISKKINEIIKERESQPDFNSVVEGV